MVNFAKIFISMKTLDQLELNGKKVIIRVDFNVPLHEDQHVTDSTRIIAAKPTIDAVLEAGGSCILMSHPTSHELLQNFL